MAELFLVVRVELFESGFEDVGRRGGSSAPSAFAWARLCFWPPWAVPLTCCRVPEHGQRDGLRRPTGDRESSPNRFDGFDEAEIADDPLEKCRVRGPAVR